MSQPFSFLPIRTSHSQIVTAVSFNKVTTRGFILTGARVSLYYRLATLSKISYQMLETLMFGLKGTRTAPEFFYLSKPVIKSE